MYGRRALTGPPAAKAFFDKVENDQGLQAALAMNNKNILTLAKELNLYFSYEEMHDHLVDRWDIRHGPPEGYCCT